MNIRAHIHNQEGQHQVTLRTDDTTHSMTVPPKTGDSGSSVNGGEMLFLALATCYCNDVYREAAREGIQIVSVDVEVNGFFGGIGEPARDVTYRAKVVAKEASEEAVMNLLDHTDTVAEVQNTLRSGIAIRLIAKEVEIIG